MPTIPGSLRSTARRVPGDPAIAFGDRGDLSERHDEIIRGRLKRPA